MSKLIESAASPNSVHLLARVVMAAYALAFTGNAVALIAA